MKRRLSRVAFGLGAFIVAISPALGSIPANATLVASRAMTSDSPHAVPWYAQSPRPAATPGSTAHVAPSTQTVTDSPGNVYDAAPPARLVPSPTGEPADLISATASDQRGLVTLSAKTVAQNDPSTDPNWRNDTYIAWAIDSKFSGTPDYFVYFQVNSDGTYDGELTSAATNTPVSCAVDLSFNTTVGYQAQVSVACLPGVTSFQWLAYSFYDTASMAQDPDGALAFGKALPDTHTDGGAAFAPPVTAPPVTSSSVTSTLSPGYWLFASDGGVFSFGSAGFYGSEGGHPLNQPVVGGAATLDGQGYWEVARDGGIFAFGDARFYGSTGGMHLNEPIVAMVPMATGAGYWLVASDGGVFSFGAARFYGSTGSIHLNEPVVGGASTPDGLGYWLVASDGGIFSFGDAQFLGSTGGTHLNKPVVGMAPDTDGGYWLVASDGGVFNYGSASFLGSTGGITLSEPVEGIAPTSDGAGYRLVASDGGVFSFGDASFLGSEGGTHLNEPVVAVASIG